MKKTKLILLIILTLCLCLFTACNPSTSRKHDSAQIDTPHYLTPKDFIEIKNATVESNLRNNVIVKFDIDDNKSEFLNIFNDENGNLINTVHYSFSNDSSYLNEHGDYIEIQPRDTRIYYSSLESLSGLIYTHISEEYITATPRDNIYEIDAREFYKQVYKTEYKSQLQSIYDDNVFNKLFDENAYNRYGDFSNYTVSLTCSESDILLTIDNIGDTPFTYIFRYYDIGKTSATNNAE